MKNKFVTFILSVFVLIILLFVTIILSFAFSMKDTKEKITLSSENDNIAILEIKGVILTSDQILEKIYEIRNEPKIRGVIVRIDSPGGAVAPSQEIYFELSKLREKIPVYASLASTAASGGYYIAAACEKIYANPGTLTGSVGVIMNFINLEKAYEFLKLKRSVIKSGEFKDIGSENRAMTENERRVLENMSKDIFDQFLGHVLKYRKISSENIKLISDARIMTGRMAKEIGLVDEIGTINDTIDAISKKAKIEDPNIIYPLRKKDRFIDYILQGAISSTISLLNSQLKKPLLMLLPKYINLSPEVTYAND